MKRIVIFALAFVFLLIWSESQAGIKKIEISEIIEAASVSEMDRLASEGVKGKNEDRVVVFVSGGELVNFTQASKRTGAVNKLTFTFDSPDFPWTAEELDTMSIRISQFYPTIEKFYGPPAFDKAINIRKNPNISYAGLYYVGLGEIVLPGADCADSLVHEIVHAFRDTFVICSSVHEEGMARAVEVAVMNHFPQYYYWNRNHSYGIDVFYELQKQSGLASRGGSFWMGFANPFMYYEQSGYAESKFLIENPQFFVRFNQIYYALAHDNPSVANDMETLKGIARSISPKIEGKKFDEWYVEQQIFNFNPPEGYQTVFKGDNNTLYLYYRDEDGLEHALTGVPVAWEIYSCNGAFLLSGESVTTDYGWVSVSLVSLAYQGKVKINFHISLPDETVMERSISTVANVEQEGIFGIITEGCEGTVFAGHTKVDVINGSFNTPALKEAGKYKIRRGNQSITITKDGPYFVVVP